MQFSQQWKGNVSVGKISDSNNDIRKKNFVLRQINSQ